MTLRRVVFPGILLVSFGLAVIEACSAPDPGLVVFSTNPNKIKDAGIGGKTGDGGSVGGDDSGPVGPPSAFDGQGAYSEASGVSTDQNDHKTQFGTTNPAGHNCFDCHSDGGVAATKFKFAGTVVDGTDAGLNQVEVRVQNPGDGGGTSTYTDIHGNFFALASAGVPVMPNALVGIRNASMQQDMPDKLTGPVQGGCNAPGTCHGGTEGAIHLP